MTEDKTPSNRGKNGGGRGRGRGRGGRGEKGRGNSGRSNNSQGNSKNQSNRRPYNRNQQTSTIAYPQYRTLAECWTRYNTHDPTLIRGTIRNLPARDGPAFCTCDRGSLAKDVVLDSPLERNRALDGDTVFVELLPSPPIPQDENKDGGELPNNNKESQSKTKATTQTRATETADIDHDSGDEEIEEEEWWQDDALQVSLWDP